MPIASAEAGDFTSLALARSGDMWSWGKGPALGHGGDDEARQLLPMMIEGVALGAPVLRIATGGLIAACVRADGSTFTLGSCNASEVTTSTPALLE